MNNIPSWVMFAFGILCTMGSVYLFFMFLYQLLMFRIGYYEAKNVRMTREEMENGNNEKQENPRATSESKTITVDRGNGEECYIQRPGSIDILEGS